MTTKTPIQLSLAAPAYNEGTGLAALVTSWCDYLRQQPMITEFEIVICNDGSTDATSNVLEQLAKTYPECRPLHFKTNQGAAAALTAAIAATRFEWVLLIDSDDQFPIENINTLLAHQQQTQTRAVMGIRDKQDSLYARVGSRMSGFICNVIHQSRLKDFNSAFKLVDGTLLRSLALEARGMNYSTEITSRLLECRIPIAEVDITHRQRKIGKSHMTLIKGSLHRLLFVSYIFMRQLLLKFGILRRPIL